MATAIQLRRHGIDGLLLEREELGGLLWNAQRVENYPGFPGGIPGPELVQLFERQFRQAGCRFSFDELRRLGRRDGLFELETGEKTFSSDVVVVATGTRPCAFPACVGTESDRVFYEVRPLLETSDAVVGVIGAGDVAFDYALNLARRNRVLLLNHGVRTRCLPLLFERVAGDPAVDYRENTVVGRVLQNPGGGLVLKGEATGTAFEAEVDYLLCAVGREPRRTLLSSLADEALRMLRDTGRLYLVGDVKNKDFRQVGISVGDGVLTAMKIAMDLGGGRK
jgi:thioredoxin reductase